MWRAARARSPEVLWVSESSPDSAETSFRELDDVFLQTRTRIWLGEVLHVSFDEDVGIADLLADGELLFQVSKEVWKILLKKHGELKHSKVHIYERTSSGKSDGRYMPYPKIDSFLKICQILGLTGIDLFSPSDVVEKRDIRRVCMCIRSLSKKARSKKLNVPDFDVVTYTISMPNHSVGVIRRSLELSQCSSSSSYGSPWNDAREICGQKFPFGLHSQQSDSGSDEVESIFIDLEFDSPLSSSSYDATHINYIVGETPPGLASVVAEIVPETGLKMDLNEAMLYTLGPVIQEDEDVVAHRLSLEERKFDKNAIFSSFEDQFMSSNLNGDTKVGSKLEQVDLSLLSCQVQENTMSKCAYEHIENHGISSNDTQGKGFGCVCDSMVEGSSISGLPCMVSTASEQQKSPEKEDTVEHTDGPFYDGISSVSDSDCSDKLEMHQSSHDASDIAFLISSYESKIPSSKQDCTTNNAPQAILDNTIYQKETIIPDECRQNEEKGRIVGKSGNQVLKSVAGVITMVGALVLFLHIRQKKDKEKNNETGVLFQIQQPNQEFFTKRQIKIGKSDSLYPAEKLKF